MLYYCRDLPGINSSETKHTTKRGEKDPRLFLKLVVIPFCL